MKSPWSDFSLLNKTGKGGITEEKQFTFHCKMTGLRVKYPDNNSEVKSWHAALRGFVTDILAKEKHLIS